MVNANELRVGNWVKSIVLHGSDFLKFKRFDEDLKIAFFYKEYIGAYIEHIAPIPLTPEILEKCGGKSYLLNNVWSFDFNTPKSYIAIDTNFKESFIVLHDEDGDEDDCTGLPLPINHIKHIHQLQNLYFSLTGEELTINL